MLQEDLVLHVRRAAQMHPHPDFTGDAGPLIASTISTSSATDTSTSSSSSTSSATAEATNTEMLPHATFLYPTETLTLNNIDVIQVSYQTVWKSVDLSIFCEMSPGSDEFALANINQIQSNGTYAIAPIQAGMKIPQFPTYCNFMLCNSQNRTDSTTAAGFTMISTQGIATTYALASTRAATDGSSTATVAQSHTGSAVTGAAVLSASTASAAAETAVSSTSRSAGLGNGAKAGIAIGVILGISALIAAIFFCIRTKRRMNKLDNMITLRSTTSSVDLAPSEKTAEHPAAASPAPVPLPSPPDNDGSSIAVFKVGENHRNSEDWRRFFGNGKTQNPAISS